MTDITILKLESCKQEVYARIQEGRKSARIVKPHNKELHLLCLRSIANLLRTLDHLDAQILELSGELITPYWIPLK